MRLIAWGHAAGDPARCDLGDRVEQHRRPASAGLSDNRLCRTGLGRIFPVTSAVASLDGVLIGHRPVTELWGTGGLAWLLGTTAAYLTAGILAFRFGERTAKNRGTLIRY